MPPHTSWGDNIWLAATRKCGVTAHGKQTVLVVSCTWQLGKLHGQTRYARYKRGVAKLIPHKMDEFEEQPSLYCSQINRHEILIAPPAVLEVLKNDRDRASL